MAIISPFEMCRAVRPTGLKYI